MSGVVPYLDPTRDAGIIGLLEDPNFTNYCIEYNAFRFGAGFNGTFWKEIDGLDLSTMRSGDSGRPRDNGEFTGYDFLGGRDLIFKGDVARGGTPNPTYTAQQNLNVVSSVFLPQANVETPLYIYLPGQAASYIDTIVHGSGGIMDPPILGVTGRPRNRSWKVDITYALGQLAQDIQLQVHCTDPRFYQYPTLTESFASSPVHLTNNGNWDCRPIVYLMSPPGPSSSVVNLPSLQINGNVMTWGNQISNIMFLIVDLYNQTVTQYLSSESAVISSGIPTTLLTAMDGSYTLNGQDTSGTSSHCFDGFTASGTAVIQTTQGLATFSYTGMASTNSQLTGCQYLSGNFTSTVHLPAYGMILQDADGGIQLAQSPYQGALQPQPGGWSATNLGSLLPGDNTIESSNCFGFVNYASAWIL